MKSGKAGAETWYRVGNGMNNVVEQPLKMAAQHFSYGFELWDAAANHPAVPKVKELLGSI